MAKKSVFDKILKKDNYTRAEVEEILLGTYEGFTAGFIDKHPKAIQKAKQEVFDDIEDWLSMDGEEDWRAWDSDYLDKYDELKKKHLQDVVTP